MTQEKVNHERRKFLTGVSCALGAIAVAGMATPFIGSWKPSARAKATGSAVEINISNLESGQQIVVEWRGQPVYIVRRTQQVLRDLETQIARSVLKDPDSQQKQQPEYISGNTRSLKQREDIIVLVGLCTHLGCAPLYRPDVGAQDLGGESWRGGFFCPCHGSKFDLAGRVYQGVPAPTNLVVPPYRFVSDNLIVIGEDVA